MKTVFSTSQCAHVWAQQTQDRGRGPSVSFSGATFYSYSTPIARFVRPTNPALGGSDVPWRVVLRTSRKYSMTTSSKHEPAVSRALPDTAVVFCVDDVSADSEREHARNLRQLVREYESTAERYMHSSADAWWFAEHQREHVLGTLTAKRETTLKYAHYFGLPRPRVWCEPASAARQAMARIAAMRDTPAYKGRAAAEAARAERKRIAEAARMEFARLEHAEQVKQWRAGADVRLPYGADRDASGGAMLRARDNGMVQTSLGAEAPIAHVRRALVLYATSPRPWSRGMDSDSYGHARLGAFTLDSIDAEGNVRAGCHFITAAEIARLRESLT